MKEHQIKVGIAEIVALFGYGHTNLWLRDYRQIPLNLYWFEEGIYVQGVHKDYKRALRARVVKIGDMTIEKALAAIKPVLSVENDQYFKANGLFYLGTPEVLHAKRVIKNLKSVKYTFEKDGKLFNMTFKPSGLGNISYKYGFVQTGGDWLSVRPTDATPLWLKYLDRNYYYEYLPESKSVYVRQSSVFNDSESIKDFYARVFRFIEENEVERLIIDLRLNGGGNNFNNKAVITGIMKSEKINQPGRLFVVLGRRTFSAAQNLVNEMENYTEVIFVGEPTAENVNFFGDTNIERLPNSDLPIRLSHAWWQDKPPWDKRQWTVPNYAVDLSFEDYITNHDPVMTVIFSSIDLKSHLTELFEIGNTKKLKKELKKYVKDPAYRYFNFTNKINQLGYQFMGVEQYKKAVDIFKLNTKLFPELANGWDSLAEGYWRSGDIDKAIKYYNKVIDLDPDGRVAENSKKMLKKLKRQL
ncbi:MAG: tetratricopeptide repeat protein [Bacteroidetes bacterium]|nr:tetratricopeptide repeat protein [Bacteroidota bacterium]